MAEGPPIGRSALRPFALAGLATVLVTLWLDWGEVCFISCYHEVPIHMRFGPLIVLAILGSAAALFVETPWVARTFSALGVLAVSLGVGLSWIFLKRPELPAFLAILGALMAWAGPFAPHRQAPFPPQDEQKAS